MNEVINQTIKYPYEEFGYYEEKLLLKEKHDKLLKILVDFDLFCRKNGINYSVADGTLLGALRHGDFIPWDDDADVMVTRTEYKKIREAIKNEKNVHLLKIAFLDRITTEEFKDEKVYIDLFINEEMPANSLAFNWRKFMTALLRNYFEGTARNARHDNFSKAQKRIYSFLHKIAGFIAKIYVGKRDVFDLNDRVVSVGKHKPAENYTRYTSRMYETRRRFNIESYEAGYGNVSFRGVQLMAILNADTFLREMYGDYMQLLPEDKRVPEHDVNMMDSTGNSIKWYN